MLNDAEIDVNSSYELDLNQENGRANSILDVWVGSPASCG